MAWVADLAGQGKGGAFGFGGRVSDSTFSNAAGAVSDLFAAEGYRAKAAGDEFERGNYLLAAQYADLNVQYTKWSTAIKQSQEDRELYKSLGQTRADVAGAGFAESGSAIDILRESASQGALARAVTGEQGLITEAGYEEQAASYRNMAQAAQVAIDAEKKAAVGADIAAGIKIAGTIAMLA
jgi:hypothetical protein